MTDLDALVSGLVPGYAVAGLAIRDASGTRSAFATAPGIRAKAQSMVRVASVSKIVTGLTFAETARRAGLHAPYDVDASDILGWSLRHPAFPDRPVTLGQIASHTAGLSDRAGYAVPTDQSLADWVNWRAEDVFADPPGQRFDYCNLGYIILAAVIEKLGAARFDLRARSYVLDPFGLQGGFNWSGVAPAGRASAMPALRRVGKDWVPQIDDQLAPHGVLGPDGATLSLAGYQPGQNPALFSPQGGLRLNLAGMLRLACALGAETHPVLCGPQTHDIADPDGLFDQYGTGLQILRAPDFYPSPLIGHFGNAYGVRTGVWWDAARSRGFAYLLNGLADGDESDALSSAERALFAAAAQ